MATSYRVPRSTDPAARLTCRPTSTMSRRAPVSLLTDRPTTPPPGKTAPPSNARNWRTWATRSLSFGTAGILSNRLLHSRPCSEVRRVAIVRETLTSREVRWPVASALIYHTMHYEPIILPNRPQRLRTADPGILAASTQTQLMPHQILPPGNRQRRPLHPAHRHPLANATSRFTALPCRVLLLSHLASVCHLATGQRCLVPANSAEPRPHPE